MKSFLQDFIDLCTRECGNWDHNQAANMMPLYNRAKELLKGLEEQEQYGLPPRK